MACSVAEGVLRRRFHELDGDKGRREYVFYGARGDNVWCMGAKVTPYEVETVMLVKRAVSISVLHLGTHYLLLTPCPMTRRARLCSARRAVLRHGRYDRSCKVGALKRCFEYFIYSYDTNCSV